MRPVSGAAALAVTLAGFVVASPVETGVPRAQPVLAAPVPSVTPFRVVNDDLPTRTKLYKRDLLGKIESGITSVLSKLGSGIPSYVASGTLRTTPITMQELTEM
jgi:hypothetical protein